MSFRITESYCFQPSDKRFQAMQSLSPAIDQIHLLRRISSRGCWGQAAGGHLVLEIPAQKSGQGLFRSTSRRNSTECSKRDCPRAGPYWHCVEDITGACLGAYWKR